MQQENVIRVKEPVVHYAKNLDYLWYQVPPVTNTGQPEKIDTHLIVFWDLHRPKSELRFTCLRFNYGRFLVEQMKAILDLRSREPLPLIKVLEVIFVANQTKSRASVAKLEQARDVYRVARGILRDVNVEPSVWQRVLRG